MNTTHGYVFFFYFFLFFYFFFFFFLGGGGFKLGTNLKETKEAKCNRN